jgi:acetylornithine deacetylase
LVGDAGETREAVAAAVAGRAELREVLHVTALRLEGFENLPTMIAKFTTDIPKFDRAWGKPFLIGPGTIHLAHTAEERIPKKELLAAVELYERMVKTLLSRSDGKCAL